MKESFLHRLEEFLSPQELLPEKELPTLSVILPTIRPSRELTWTLTSLSAQSYPSLQLIVIDPGRFESPASVIPADYPADVRIHRVAETNLFEMMNRGISLASGEYLTFLVPGDAYLSVHSLSIMARLIANGDSPDLAYSGCLIREAGQPPHTLFALLTLKGLQRGELPTALHACWWKRETLRKLGKFNPKYSFRGTLDLLCRFMSYEKMCFLATERPLVEHDRLYEAPGELVGRGWETGNILAHYFGKKVFFRWILAQRPWRYLKWWLQTKKHLVR